ncbi:Codanin-1 [Manis pentadactyla]|nr:Codanin-1 [Manis pentadactyla]
MARACKQVLTTFGKFTYDSSVLDTATDECQRSLMAPLGEATVQKTEEVETAIYTTFFRKLGSEENMREKYYQAVAEDPPEAHLLFRGSIPAVGPPLKYSLRRGHSFRGFQQIEVVPCSKKQRDAEFEPEGLTWHFMYLKLEEV